MAKDYFASLTREQRFALSRKGSLAYWDKRGRTPLLERFESKVHRTDGCWIWKGATVRGYGCIRSGDKILYAHRISYEAVHGPIASGLYVCHRCDNPICVNPAHLFAGTPTDNVRDAKSKGRVRNNPSRGEKSPHAKLTEVQVRELRNLYATGSRPKELGLRFGVSDSAAKSAATGKTWAHVQ